VGVYDDGHTWCYACKTYGTQLNLEGPEFVQARVAVARRQERQYTGPLPWAMVDAYQDLLHGSFSHRKAWFLGRGLTEQTIEKLRFGHTGKEFVIPVWDYAEQLLTIRYRRDDVLWDIENARLPKYRSMKGHKVQLYGAWQILHGKVVYVTEGELDAALLMQEFWKNTVDAVAISTTGGAGADVGDVLNGMGLGYHHAEEYILLYDQDDAGKKAAFKALQSLEEAPLVDKSIATWPEKWGKDVTEAINTVGFPAWWDYVQSCLD
jgi:hypothetical protein